VAAFVFPIAPLPHWSGVGPGSRPLINAKRSGRRLSQYERDQSTQREALIIGALLELLGKYLVEAGSPLCAVSLGNTSAWGPSPWSGEQWQTLRVVLEMVGDAVADAAGLR
jgi:hypothetical protein